MKGDGSATPVMKWMGSTDIKASSLATGIATAAAEGQVKAKAKGRAFASSNAGKKKGGCQDPCVLPWDNW